MSVETLVLQLAEELKQRGWMCATAESCTGGGVGQALTSVTGSSRWYDRGFITYSNQAKREMLGVSTNILARFGAVSEQAARAMAEGALARSRAQVALAVTGIAGPGGGTVYKPVGTVYLAWTGKGDETLTRQDIFFGDRNEIRAQAIEVAISGLLTYIIEDSR